MRRVLLATTAVLLPCIAVPTLALAQGADPGVEEIIVTGVREQGYSSRVQSGAGFTGQSLPGRETVARLIVENVTDAEYFTGYAWAFQYGSPRTARFSLATVF